MRDLSELEGAVLGVVEERAPCTAYAVRKVFKESPVHHWQASAGAIYPVVARLGRARLLAAKASTRGSSQRTQEYSITAAGRKALRAWLLGQSNLLAVPPDPLRTRIFFFSKLTSPERLEALNQALAQIEGESIKLEADSRRNESNDQFAHFASRGALKVARARRQWIKEMIRALTEDTDETPKARR